MRKLSELLVVVVVVVVTVVWCADMYLLSLCRKIGGLNKNWLLKHLWEYSVTTCTRVGWKVHRLTQKEVCHSNDYFLFPYMKKTHAGKQYQTDDDVIYAVDDLFFEDQDESFYTTGIQAATLMAEVGGPQLRAGEIMLKNKTHLWKFDHCIIVRLWTFQPTLVNSENTSINYKKNWVFESECHIVSLSTL